MIEFLRDKLYIVYDSKVETEESLNKFITKVIEPVKIDSNHVKTVTLEVVERMAENNILPAYCLGLNQTYKDLQVLYSNSIDTPIYDFYTKEFVQTDLKVCLSGILLDIDSVFEDAYKRYSWNIVKKLASNYAQFSSEDRVTIEQNEEIPSYLNMRPLEEVEKEVVKKPISEEVVNTYPEIEKQTEQAPPLKEVVNNFIKEDSEKLLDDIQTLFSLYESVKKRLGERSV